MDRNIRILKLIPQDDYITYQSLSDKLQLSKRTIYNEITDLDDLLLDNGARIISKPRYGLRLEISDEEKYSRFLNSFAEEEVSDYLNSETRALQIARDMLIGALVIVAILFFTKPKLEA